MVRSWDNISLTVFSAFVASVLLSLCVECVVSPWGRLQLKRGEVNGASDWSIGSANQRTRRAYTLLISYLCVCVNTTALRIERERDKKRKKEKRENNYGYINLDLKKENSKRKNQPHYTTTNTHFHHNFHSTYYHQNIQFLGKRKSKEKTERKKRK